MAKGADDSDSGPLMLAEVKWLEAGRREEERIYSRSNPCCQMRNYFLTLIRVKNVPIHSQNWAIPTCPIRTTECHLPQTAQIRQRWRFPNKHGGVDVVWRLTSRNLTNGNTRHWQHNIRLKRWGKQRGWFTWRYTTSCQVTSRYVTIC